jgi:polyphosphate kinase 2 (PPK2 family)
MGFASETQVEEFFHDVPEFERMLVRCKRRLQPIELMYS